ncbi:FGGY-family carbohydrate kinase [Kallipyga gabonensis]|uniref:FGGY-family carbohydrate kinase n=1 Tax=Kallipyga gabonensis TaxID=1686287 RepID=UPI00093F1B95|nr:FGGY family carbohydrate kinase [Kallipyga gabonensis]
MKKYFMGVDVGTQQTKGILIDQNLRPVTSYAVSHTIENSQPYHYEMDANIWWDEFCQISKELQKSAGIESQEIAGVGVSVMGCDCISVDREVKPIRKAILYGIDARSVDQIRKLDEDFGEEKVLEMFGHKPNSDDISTKILWIKENEPEVFKKTYKFLTGSSYMVAKLTGNYWIDQYLAKGSFRPLYNDDGSFNNEYSSYFCTSDQLAKTGVVTDIAGGVNQKAAEETGLKEGTPVIIGTGDSTAESVASGLLEEDILFAQVGSTLFYIFSTNQKIPSCDLDNFPGSEIFTVPGIYAVMGGTNAAGSLTGWIRDEFYFPERDREKGGGQNAFKIMAEEAAEIPAGSTGLVILPYIHGERSPIHDPKARGVIFGLRGQHDRKSITRASLEAVAYSIGSHLRLFKKHNLIPNKIILAGGGTKNKVWMQIMADVLQSEICIAEDWQTASFGDACMAAVGSGELADFKELADALPHGRIIRPNPDNFEIYQKYLDIYEELYRRNKDLMHALS